MGCNSSSATKPTVEAARRRLSVGQSSGGGNEVEETPQDEDDRGLITQLGQEEILQIIAADGQGGRKFSIGSGIDAGKQSFASKKVDQKGDEVDTAALGLGYSCRKGLKPESPNQDSWCVLKMEDFSIYGVFDGHGQRGHDVSLFVKDNLPKLIIRDTRFQKGSGDVKAVLFDAFRKMQSLIAAADQMKKFDAKLSGTTATVCVHDHNENKIYLAHVADSTATIGTYTDGVLKGTHLTRDHKPDLKDERARIEKAGGRVVFDGYANHRIYAKNGRYPGLNMSRCLGDLLGHQDCGCSAEPEVTERPITNGDHVLLLCSDGVWEFIKPEDAVQMVNKFKSAQAMAAAEHLAKEAWDRWIKEEGGAVVDDITVVLIYLRSIAMPKD